MYIFIVVNISLFFVLDFKSKTFRAANVYFIKKPATLIEYKYALLLSIANILLNKYFLFYSILY